MLTTHVVRGLKAGFVAGLAFGLFVALVANPLIGFAEEFEHGNGDHEAATGAHPTESGESAPHGGTVSTVVANAVSVISGVLWGVLLGAVVFGVVHYFLEPALPGTGGTESYLLAAAGFVTVSGAPWLVLPPRPPGVEQALPTDTRVLLYGGMMIAGALVCMVAGLLYGRLSEERGRTTAAVAAVLPVGSLAIPVVLAPANPVESSLPPELATGLTGMIVFGQALLWLLLAGTHARLGRRSTESRSDGVETPHADPTAAAD